MFQYVCTEMKISSDGKQMKMKRFWIEISKLEKEKGFSGLLCEEEVMTYSWEKRFWEKQAMN